MNADDYLIDPMRLIEAEAWVIAKLGPTARAAHSRFVGLLMRALALEIEPGQADLWEITGLVHDLDFFVVDGDWAIHGRTTAAWLERRLPIPALLAIAAHDHRSGVISEAAIARALRLSDALAVLDETAGRPELLEALRSGEAGVTVLSGKQPYLGSMIVGNATALGLPLDRLAAVLAVQETQQRA